MNAPTRVLTQPIQLTRLSNKIGLLTKEFRLDEGGNLAKSTKAFLTDGTATKVTVSSLEEYSVALTELQPNECFAYGVTEHDTVEVVVRAKLHEHPGKIARDRKHFHYRKAPAIMMLDHDADPTKPPLTREVLHAALVAACPALAGVAMLWAASASSNIIDIKTGKQLTGLSGQRVYIPVRDGTDIPRAGKALYEHLWRSGHGRFVVSKGARLLDRNLIDSSVWQPERVDFAAGASCIAPLEQQRPDHVFLGEPNTLFDSTQILELTRDEKDIVAGFRRDARTAIEGERLEKRTAYIETSAAELAKERGIELERAKQVIAEALDRDFLFADFVLRPEHGGAVTVGEVLDQPAQWHGKRFADPIELDYGNDARVAYANLHSGGSPYIFSHAHGGHRYLLLRQPSLLRIESGELPRLADECLNLIRQRGDLFDFGYRQLVRVAEGRIHPVSPIWASDYLGRIVRFERFDMRAKDWRPTDTPDRLAKIVCERAGERGLPKLRAIVTAPTLRRDGTVLDEPGFDVESGLLYLSDEVETHCVPPNPTEDQVLNALYALWRPFQDFPFADDVARGAMLSALLSAVIRRSLPTCPGHVFDAPVMGSGKTLLAKCIAALGGHTPELSVPPSEDEEARKSLFASLREGAGCIIWDNLVNPINGAAINNFLTAEIFKDRVLGVSESEALPNTALFLATGNNVRVQGDAARRFVVCRIDARVERPYLREFTFDPLQWVVANRVDMVIAALTIIRGYLTAGSPRMAPGNTASFEAWDGLVRQAVCWISSINVVGGYADPMKTVEKSAAMDPQQGILRSILEAWHGYFGDAELTSAEVCAANAQDFDTTAETLARMRFSDAMAGLGTSGRDGMNAVRFGKYFAEHEDAIADGFVLRSRQDTHKKVKLWRVEQVNKAVS